jgi:hypothetical protein
MTPLPSAARDRLAVWSRQLAAAGPSQQAGVVTRQATAASSQAPARWAAGRTVVITGAGKVRRASKGRLAALRAPF